MYLASLVHFPPSYLHIARREMPSRISEITPKSTSGLLFVPNLHLTRFAAHLLNRRHCQVFGLTDGLKYLHSQQVVHGDLKGVRNPRHLLIMLPKLTACQQQSNLLIGSTGQTLVCDFGVSRIIGKPGFTTAVFGTPPFMAPELFPDPPLIDEDASDNDETDTFSPEFTKETDVYAYGLTLLQVCSRISLYPARSRHAQMAIAALDPHWQSAQALLPVRAKGAPPAQTPKLRSRRRSGVGSG